MRKGLRAMSAQVIDFADAVHRKSRPQAMVRPDRRNPAMFEHDFLFWTGASGRRYVHTIYSLIDCPELAKANFILVCRTAEGQRDVLQIGRLEHDAQSLNLAQIRHVGATLGANEVHVHLLGESAAQRTFIELDVRSAVDGACSIDGAQSSRMANF